MSDEGYIKLPKVRLRQIQLIADAHNITVVGALERLIRAEQKAGTIDQDLPGFDAELTTGKDGRPWVRIQIGGHSLPAMKGEAAEAFADLISRHAMARGKDNGTKMALADGTTLAMGRRGRAMVFRVARGDEQVVHATLTDSMIGDFCCTICGSAAYAQYAEV